MTKDKRQHTIDDLLEKISSYISDTKELEKIKTTYLFAKEKHDGQFRKTGEEYITHPLEVAYILTGIYADVPTLQAALLHDVLEDTSTEEDDIASLFGREVAFLVQGVTKLGRIHFSAENEYLIDYYKKIIVGMSEDVRVIIIKLADRLHNMRTLWALPREKQKVKAKETLEILAPIAHHLGIHKIKGELEDLCLRYLKPEVFYDIAEKLNNTKLERDNAVFEMMQEVTNLLNEHNIPHEIKGRSKSIYSIYNKLNKGKKFNNIYDLLAMRILVNTEQECYLVLGIIHSKFRPMPGRFKDYIAMPKANMYQSLHTTVFGSDGNLFEIQIRTYSMNEIAENGVASHWAYKEHKDASVVSKNTTEQKLQFFKSIIELSEDKMSSEDFVNSVRDEVLNNNIYCFTPMGDVIELPKGATPIDFAYKVHTRVGETMVGAIVNNNIVPLNCELQDNDIVKINTNKNSNGPSKEWLKIAKCTQTKNKIKSFFSKSEKEDTISRGQEVLEKELRRRKINFQDFYKEDNLSKVLKETKCTDLDDLYFTVGNGKNSATNLVNIIDKPREEAIIKEIRLEKNDSYNDVIVAGIDKVRVNVAACCNPIPGDEIIGYITKGNGISIHRSSCHNLDTLESRMIPVSWNSMISKKYLSSIVIYTKDAENHFMEVAQKLSIFNVLIDKINTINKVDQFVYEIDLYVKDLEHLNKILMEVNKLSFVDRVERLMR